MNAKRFLLAAVLVALAGCGGGDKETAAPAEESTAETPSFAGTSKPVIANGTLAVTSSDGGYGAPTFRIAAGPTTISLENAGTFGHELRLVQVDDGPPLLRMIQMPRKKIESFVTELGATERVPAGETAAKKLHVKLKLGKYVLMCLIKGFSGQLHAAAGMYRQIAIVKSPD